MHIEDQALVYSGGGWKVDVTAVSGTDKVGKVDNYGDVMIEGVTGDGFDTTKTAGGLLGEFNLKTKTNTFDHLNRVYGQLYISGIAQKDILGKARKEYYEANHSGADNTGRQQMALPFYQYDIINDLEKDLVGAQTGVSLNHDGNRYNNGNVFRWNNATASFDHVRYGVVGDPTDYFIVPKLPKGGLPNGTALWMPDNSTTPKVFTGVPISDDVKDNYTRKLLSGAFSGSFGAGGGARNNYNGKYNTYFWDFISDKTPWDTTNGWGMNSYQLGNPFLTNIDLSLAHTSTDSDPNSDGNAITEIEGYYYYDAGGVKSSDRTQGTTYTDANVVIVKVSSTGILTGGKTGTGLTTKDNTPPVESVVFRPMQAFVMKLRSTPTNAPYLDFKSTRRFAQSARLFDKQYHVTAQGLAGSTTQHQLGVSLLDANGTEIGRTFYVVSNVFETGVEKGVSNQSRSPYTTIYTKEEVQSGGADNVNDIDLHINAANSVNFAGKEIPLIINSDRAAKLKFFLIEQGRNVADGKNLSNGKAFYIKKDNVLTKISDLDEVAITSGTYGLYYEKPNASVSSTNLLNGETFIGKKDSDFIVRFNKDWKSADVEVYTAAGQLIHAKSNVNTFSDYVLPIQANGLFLVKVKSEKGELVTKKIIK